MMKTMQRYAMIPVMVLVTALAAGCEGDGLADREDTLVGDFRATEAVFTDAADPNNRFDVVAEGGTFDMRFDRNGTFTSTLTVPNRPMVTRTGTFQVQGSNLRLTEGGQTRTATITRNSGGTVGIVDAGSRFDFGTGTDRAASFRGTLQPR